MTATTGRSNSSAPLLRLNFEVKPGGDVAAYLPVRWCVDPERLLAELTNCGYTKPHLLICIQHVQSESTFAGHTTLHLQDTAYYIVPLQHELAYIAFRRPGINRVLAVIVDVDSPYQAEKLWRLERRVPEGWYDSFFDEDGKPIRDAFSHEGIPFIETGTLQEVEVDPEMFAPEPAQWRKDIVRVFFRGKENDQCHFRRRFWLFSLEMFPLLVAITTILKFVVAVVAGVFLGLYGVNYKSVIQPLKLSPQEPIRHAGDSRYLSKRPKGRGYESEAQWPVFWVVNPTVLLVPAVVMFVFTDWGWWNTLLIVDLWILGGGAFLTIVAGICVGISVFVSRVTGSVSYKQNRVQLKQDAARKRQEALDADIVAMSCTSGDKTASVDALPRKKRTIRLRFSKVKGSICKPFAK